MGGNREKDYTVLHMQWHLGFIEQMETFKYKDVGYSGILEFLSRRNFQLAIQPI